MLCAIAIVAVLIVISMKLSYKRFARVQKAIDKINIVVQEYLLGVRLVKAFGRYEGEEKRFASANSDLYEKSVASQIVIAYFSPVMSLTISTGIAAILYMGSILFGSGQLEVGKVAAFINYMSQILFSMIMITNIFNTFIRTKASSERIEEVLAGEEDFTSNGGSKEFEAGALEFRDVCFAYPGGSGQPVLKNLSFKIDKGETLAVIGPTGSGKSTLSWLCVRFYDVNEGAISIGGINIKDIKTSELRDNIALAPQKSILFTGTVGENLSYGKAAAEEAQLIEAAVNAQAHGFIEKMEKRYDSILGQNGVNLSGGQKQRLSIARALAKEAPIIILDDCTSALDAITEAKVRKGLRSLDNRSIIIMITQRVGTAMTADRILVLDNGVNVGFGKHADLLENCSTYREIYDSQIGGAIVPCQTEIHQSN